MEYKIARSQGIFVLGPYLSLNLRTTKALLHCFESFQNLDAAA